MRINCDATPDELIDVIEGNRIYVPCVYALNKIDAICMEELDILDEVPHYCPISSPNPNPNPNVNPNPNPNPILDEVPHYCPISSHYKWNLEGLLDMVFEYLNMTRVYTKPKGQMPDYSAPVILRGHEETTVEAFCNRIHRSLLGQLKHALVWGSSVKHNPGVVGKTHVLNDEDVVQLVKKN